MILKIHWKALNCIQEISRVKFEKREKSNFLTGSAVVGLALRFFFINHLLFRLKKSRCKQDLVAPIFPLEARGGTSQAEWREGEQPIKRLFNVMSLVMRHLVI